MFDKRTGPPIAALTGVSKWVSIIECINGNGGALNPFLIHIGQEPKDAWFVPNEDLPDWAWSFSSKGWTTNELGLHWLKEWFIPWTKREGKYRLLILDQHDTYMNDEFCAVAAANDIHLFYLPLYTSGILQPLDTGPFSPLSNYYSQELQLFTPDGFSTIDRATFTYIYCRARPRAFTAQNIKLGWTKSGWFPLNKQRIKNNDTVRNWERRTPELRPPPSQPSLYDTPRTTRQVEDLIRRC